MSSFLNIPQKKGDATAPHGMLTVYAKILVDHHELSSMDAHMSPLEALTRSGFLVAQGNYRDQRSLRDFLAQEFGTSMDDEEGLKHFVEGLGGIEGALDPEKFKEKLQELEVLEDF